MLTLEECKQLIKEINEVKTVAGKKCENKPVCDYKKCSNEHDTPSKKSHKAQLQLQKYEKIIKKMSASAEQQKTAKSPEEQKGATAHEQEEEKGSGGISEELFIELSCCICTDMMDNPVTALMCMHNFCKQCIE